MNQLQTIEQLEALVAELQAEIDAMRSELTPADFRVAGKAALLSAKLTKLTDKLKTAKLKGRMTELSARLGPSTQRRAAIKTLKSELSQLGSAIKSSGGQSITMDEFRGVLKLISKSVRGSKRKSTPDKQYPRKMRSMGVA